MNHHVVEVQGRVIVRYFDAENNPYHITYKSKIDALLGHVQKQLEINQTHLLDLIGVSRPSVSRYRTGKNPGPIGDCWFLSLHEVSNIPVAELRQVACTPTSTPKHKKTRP